MKETTASGTEPGQGTGGRAGAALGGMPLLRHERVWGFWNFTSVNVSPVSYTHLTLPTTPYV